MNGPNLESIDSGLDRIGLRRAGLRVEAFRTDGTSNYLANLNFQGQTWAAALRLPARGADLAEFVDDKRRALRSVAYLAPLLRSGIRVSRECTLRFDGISCLVDGVSTQQFLHGQFGTGALTQMDRVLDREKAITGFSYPVALADDVRSYVSEYTGPFYLSRGAPAWETLEEYPEFEQPVANALAKLHLLTGKGKPVAFGEASQALTSIKESIEQAALKWTPADGSKEQAALTKAMGRWQASEDPERSRLVRIERFIRTATGRQTYRASLEAALSHYRNDRAVLKSFVHGDCHGGNFIIVRYEYVLNRPDVLLDRVFLNDIFNADGHLNEVAIRIDPNGAHVVYVLPEPHDETGLRARRHRHHEIHLIDLDGGRGTSEATKELHLFDAISYAISLNNITSLVGHAVTPLKILEHYYAGMERAE